MKKIVKSCDLPGLVAAKLFVELNKGKVVLEHQYGKPCLITDENPEELVHPEGWYYAKESFRNKHNSSTGMYSEVPMFRKSDF